MRLILARQSLPHVGYVYSYPQVEVLQARAFRAAHFFTALSNRLASASRTPLVNSARHAVHTQ